MKSEDLGKGRPGMIIGPRRRGKTVRMVEILQGLHQAENVQENLASAALSVDAERAQEVEPKVEKLDMLD